MRILIAVLLISLCTASCGASGPGQFYTVWGKPSPTPALPATCDLYPITVNSHAILNRKVGEIVTDLPNVPASTGFDWLAAGDDGSDAALIAAFQAPPQRNLAGLPEPGEVRAHGRLGDSPEARAALDALQSRVLTVPVWNWASGVGADLQYGVQQYVWIQITGYQLGEDNRLSFRYLGPAVCPPPTPVPGVKLDQAAAILADMMKEPGAVRTHDECSQIYKILNYCQVVASVTSVQAPVWQALLPRVNFFLVQAASFNRELEIVPDGAAMYLGWQVLAISDGKRYGVDQFPALLDANSMTINDQNQEQVAQAAVLMTLPYYLDNEIVFSDAQEISIVSDIRSFNYKITAWTRSHGVKIDYYFTFDGPELKGFEGQVTGIAVGEGFVPAESSFEPEPFYNHLRLDYRY